MTTHSSYVVMMPIMGIQIFMLLVTGAFLVAALLFFRSERRAHTLVFVIGAGGETLFQLWQFFLLFRPVSETPGITLVEPSDWAIHKGISIVCWSLMAYGLVSIAYVGFRRKMLETPHDDGLK